MSTGHNASFLVVFGMLLISSVMFYTNVSAESVPSWVQNTALWYGQGNITEAEFINAIKFLIEHKIIMLEDSVISEITTGFQTANIIIPNGNANIEHTGFYIPLNLEVKKGTTVVWTNDDTVLHTVQSIDKQGNIVGLFNSPPLKTGEQFTHTFDKSGEYNYYCSLHPWRVGLVTVR